MVTENEMIDFWIYVLICIILQFLAVDMYACMKSESLSMDH